MRDGMWRPDGTVMAISIRKKRIFVAGDFTRVTGPQGEHVRRVRIMALHRKTGALVTKFHPRVNGTVRSLAVFRGNLYLGGDFTEVNGSTRRHLAAVRMTDGHLVKHWKAQVNGTVSALLHMRTRLYVGGNFTAVNGVHRARLFALNRMRKPVRGWPAKPRGANGPIFSLARAPGGHAVLVGGHFHELVNHARINLGAVAVHGHVTKWKPASVCSDICPVRDLAVKKATVYAGIDGPGGVARAYRWPSGSTVWSADTDGEIDAVAVAGASLVIGGHFGHVELQPHPMIAFLNRDSGLVNARTIPTSGPWFPGVLDIRVSGRLTLLGGAFDDIASQRRLAAIRS